MDNKHLTTHACTHSLHVCKDRVITMQSDSGTVWMYGCGWSTAQVQQQEVTWPHDHEGMHVWYMYVQRCIAEEDLLVIKEGIPGVVHGCCSVLRDQGVRTFQVPPLPFQSGQALLLERRISHALLS